MNNRYFLSSRQISRLSYVVTSRTSLLASTCRTKSIECIAASGWTWRRVGESARETSVVAPRHLLHTGRPLKRVCCLRRYRHGRSPVAGERHGLRRVRRQCRGKRKKCGNGSTPVDRRAIGSSVAAACRSTRRSRMTAWRATRASYYICRSLYARKNARTPLSRSRRSTAVSVSVLTSKATTCSTDVA